MSYFLLVKEEVLHAGIYVLESAYGAAEIPCPKLMKSLKKEIFLLGV